MTEHTAVALTAFPGLGLLLIEWILLKVHQTRKAARAKTAESEDA
jgi:hypothetical protein